MITVYDDAPEENKETAEPQACEGDRRRLYFRAVGEPWFESRKIKIRLSQKDNLIFLVECGRQRSRAPYAKKCYRICFGLSAKAQSPRLRSIKKDKPQGLILFYWSKWRDSNSRPPVPEQLRHRFLTTFVDFLVLFSPKTMLSDALVRTVST